jgi:hypothetical protein
MLRLGNAASGTAQTPGRMNWPSVRLTVDGTILAEARTALVVVAARQINP